MGQRLGTRALIDSSVRQGNACLQAYRALAKVHHPDKGGDPARFSRIQQAFEVLSDPQQREVYDQWARNLQFRYVRGATPQVKERCIFV